MRIRDQRAYDEPGIDLVPLIDVILVLIIFFVITTTFDVRSTLQLQLPVASPQAPPPARTLNIIVNADGRYFVGEREVLQTGIEAVKQAISLRMASLPAAESGQETAGVLREGRRRTLEVA